MLEELQVIRPPEWGCSLSDGDIFPIRHLQKSECRCGKRYAEISGLLDKNVVGFSHVIYPSLYKRSSAKVIGTIIFACPICGCRFWGHYYDDYIDYYRSFELWPKDENGKPL
jgi:hypothetical protein